MLLIVTRRDDLTADYVILELQRQGHRYFRLNAEDFPTRLKLSLAPLEKGKSRIHLGKKQYNLSDFETVWYRRAATRRLSASRHPDFSESESREALDWLWKSINAFWVSHPARIQAAEGKAHQATFASAHGFAVPKSIVTNDPDAAREFWHTCGGRVVAKALRQKVLETRRGRRIIFTSRVAERDLDRLNDLKLAPALFQEEIPKAFDVRVNAIGRRLFATRIDSQTVPEARLDWRAADASQLPHRPMKLPTTAADLCIKMVDEYDLQFGAFDFVVTPQGEWFFLELNPNGQWAWIEPLTGQPLRKAMVDLLTSRKEAK